MALAMHTFLREHCDEIVREWETLASAEPCQVKLAGAALRDRLPDLLNDLADWMELGDEPSGATRLGASAALHAVQRLDHSFQLAQLLQEYRLLRATILRDLLREDAREQAITGTRGLEERGIELARLNAGLDLAISDAVEHFIAQRDRRLADLQASELARRAAESRYDNLVHLSPDAILVDRNGQIEFANPASLTLFGAASVHDLVGRSAFDLIHRDDHATVRERVRRLLGGEVGVNPRAEVTIVRLDGTTRSVDANAALFEDARGKAIEVVLRDITDRKRADEALRASEERLRAHIDNSPLAVVEFDPQFTVTRWSQEAERLFGWTAGEIIGRKIEEVRWVHDDDVESVRRESARLSGEGTRTLNVNRNYRKDGTTVHCEWYNSALHDGQGRLISILSQVLDVTDRKRAEEELRESEERFRTLADNIAQLAWMADEKGSTFWYNKRWFDFTGTTLDEVQGWGWQKVHHPDHVGHVVEKITRCFQAGEPWEDTFQLRGRDGAYRWFLSRAVPIRDESGRVVRWFGTSTDVTEQREAQEALRAADQRKTEFLAVLSHELRNYLAPIKNGLRLLERTPPGSPQSRRAREIIRRQMDHVTSLVDDLLDISVINTGKIRLERTRFDVREVVHRVCEDIRATFEERGIALKLDVAAEPLWVDADETRLTQIAGNLLGNALKFTSPPGSVDVTIRKEARTIELSVRDTGAGIEPQLLGKIFEPFAQAERTRGTARGGMGIGLTLVKNLVTMHGGTVRAQSAGEGKGAEFIVSLPLSGAPAVHGPKPAAPAAISSLAILLIEDNRDAAETLEQLLQLEGHRTRLAFDGASGMEAFREFAPDVLISDVSLPDVSGYDLMRRIRQLETRRPVYAIALTGYAQADDIERAREAGFDAHLAKPTPLERLDALLAEAAASNAEEEKPSSSPPRRVCADESDEDLLDDVDGVRRGPEVP